MPRWRATPQVLGQCRLLLHHVLRRSLEHVVVLLVLVLLLLCSHVPVLRQHGRLLRLRLLLLLCWVGHGVLPGQPTRNPRQA